MSSLFGRTYLNRCRLVRGELLNQIKNYSTKQLQSLPHPWHTDLARWSKPK